MTFPYVSTSVSLCGREVEFDIPESSRHFIKSVVNNERRGVGACGLLTVSR